MAEKDQTVLYCISTVGKTFTLCAEKVNDIRLRHTETANSKDHSKDCANAQVTVILDITGLYCSQVVILAWDTYFGSKTCAFIAMSSTLMKLN